MRPHQQRVPSASSRRFAVVGDLQRTSRMEFWRERNTAETERILAEVLAQRPAFVVLLGDLVFRGSSARDWKRFDRLIAPLRDAEIDVYPILGNHDYWLSPRRALAQYFRRFADLQGRRWYARAYEGIGLVFLDSNWLHLRGDQWIEQRYWYESALARLDGDPAIRGILVFVHHPPYTNSTLTGDTLSVQGAFVPAFARSEKTLAMISGHVHSYERFVRKGKTFLVAGGGGGPRARLAVGHRRRHDDDTFAGPPLRLLHFLMARVLDHGVEIDALGLDKRGAGFSSMDRFLLQAPLLEQALSP